MIFSETSEPPYQSQDVFAKFARKLTQEDWQFILDSLRNDTLTTDSSTKLTDAQTDEPQE